MTTFDHDDTTESIQQAPTMEPHTYESLCAFAENLPGHFSHVELDEAAEQRRQGLVVQAFNYFEEQQAPLLAALNQLLGEEESADVEDILTDYLTSRIQTRASHVYVFAQFYTSPEHGRFEILAGALSRMEQPRSLERIIGIAQWLIANPPGATLDDAPGFVG